MGRCGRRRSTPRICGRNGTRLEQRRVCIPRPPCPAPRDTQQQTLRLAGCPCAGAEAGMKGFSFRDGLLLLRITEADSETFCACKATGRKRRRIRKNGRISRKRCRECIWRLILPDSSTANGGSCSSAASVCFENGIMESIPGIFVVLVEVFGVCLPMEETWKRQVFQQICSASCGIARPFFSFLHREWSG